MTCTGTLTVLAILFYSSFMFLSRSLALYLVACCKAPLVLKSSPKINKNKRRCLIASWSRSEIRAWVQLQKPKLKRLRKTEQAWNPKDVNAAL